MPVERVREDPAEQHADAAAAGGDEAEDAHRLGPVGRLGEQRHHQRERDRGDDRGAEALHGPRSDQELLRVREAAGERGEREERRADQEQAPVPEEVAQPAAEQQKAAEREQVGVHDPGERRLGEAEVLPDRRQRDTDDRHVEHDHQVAQAEDVECEPAGAVVDGHCVELLSVVMFSIGFAGKTAGRRGIHRSGGDEFRPQERSLP